MSTWKELVVDVVDDLYLDPNNVRLEHDADIPQADIIQDLFKNERTLDLVESIAKVGFLTHELPITVRRNGKLVVAEGNRRVAALKSIQNPYLAPEYQARITRLTRSIQDIDALRRISVKLSPSQSEADQLIAALHTGNQRRPWGPTRQDAFFQAQLDAGKTPKQLIDQYPTIDVRKFVIRSQILNLFRNVHYADPRLQDFVGLRKFPVSTLARLYENDKFLELAQIEVDDKRAIVELKASPSDFGRLAEKIISDIYEKRINTRILNKTSSKSYKSYMDELRELISSPYSNVHDYTLRSNSDSQSLKAKVPHSGQNASRTRATEGDSSGRASRNADTSGSGNGLSDHSGKKLRRNQASFLNTENLYIRPGYPPSIRKILAELSTINVNRFPNATLDLLRTFLEKTIKAYAESLGENIKSSSSDSGFVFLKNCLIWLEQHVKEQQELRSYIQVIAKLRSGRMSGYVPTMDHLNAINHNHHILATPEDVRECWDVMEGLLKVMLRP